MKIPRLLCISSAIVLMTSCNFHYERTYKSEKVTVSHGNTSSHSMDYTIAPTKSGKSLTSNCTSAELLGKWKQVTPHESLSDTDSKIAYIQLMNDSIAKIQVRDANGEREITGKWETNYEKQLKKLRIGIKSDIRVTWFQNDNHLQWLLLKLREENEQLTMTGRNYTFKKE